LSKNWAIAPGWQWLKIVTQSQYFES
jgi:hypothetical protein